MVNTHFPDRLRNQQAPTVSKTAAYTITTDDSVILADSSSAAFTLTLPAAADAENKVFTIKKVNSDNNDVTIDASGAETIDGVANFVLEDQYSSVTMVSDGTEWHILHTVTGRGSVKLAKIAFGATELSGSEVNTSFIAPVNGMVVTNAFIYVADGESGTMDVGTQGTSNDPDGLLDGIDLTNTGWVFPTVTRTGGLNATYVSATTFGALTHLIDLGTDAAGDEGGVHPRGTFITGGDPVSITSSADLNSCSGYLFLEYMELPSVA